MNLLGNLTRRLGWRLFLSYLVVVVVGVVVLGGTAELVAPETLDRHAALMHTRLGADPALVADLHKNFHDAINEVLAVSGLAAALAAVAISLFTTRRIVDPVRDMMEASGRIANGDYHSRVDIPSQDELGALAHAFNQMAETLERTEQRRLELIGDVAHELRTPLGSIRSVMEGLVDGVLPAEPATFLGIQREVARLQRLVYDLSELSRAEAGQIVLDIHPVSPADLVSSAADRLRPQFEDKGVDLVIDVADVIRPVGADAGRITQVLLNLLGNALQYTPPDGCVTARAWQEGDDIFFSVSDTGIGIPPEHLPHIFERFYRVDKSRSRAGGGSGIGLTISKHLVEAHGGRVWATSGGTQAGSTFTFALPAAP